MLSIDKQPLPGNALLRRYDRDGHYTDCYTTVVSDEVSSAEFVFAFYTTPLFRLERLILRWLIKRPSTDDEARAVADGSGSAFAAWTVEARDDEQLLMCDLQQRTRSWFMVASAGDETRTRTRLYFGSAVCALVDEQKGTREIGPGYRLLLGFHKLYSILLLRSARARLS